MNQQLTQSQRQMLLEELKKVDNSIDVAKACISKAKGKDEELLELYEIDLYLRTMQFELITTTLVRNELDWDIISAYLDK